MTATETGAKKSVVGNIKEKIFHIIDKVSNEIAKLWDKLVNWFRMKIEANVQAYKQIKAISNYQLVYDNFREFDKPEIHFDKYVDLKGIGKLDNTITAIKKDFIANGAISSDKLTSENIKDTVKGIFNKLDIIKEDYTMIPLSIDFLKSAAVVYDVKKASSSVFKNILDTKTIINEEFRKLKNETRDRYEDVSQRREFMNEVNLTSRMYSMFTSEAIKVYHIFYDCAYKICKGCVTNYREYLRIRYADNGKEKK